MASIKIAQRENAHKLLREIEKCETEEALEEVNEIAWEMVQARLITKRAYRAIEEAQDDRILTLVEEGKI